MFCWIPFEDISIAIDVFLSKIAANTIHIDEYKFKSLHGYIERSRNYETIILNKVLLPLIKKNLCILSFFKIKTCILS